MRDKIGRNQPCPCGIRKKYKNCCRGRVDWGTIIAGEWSYPAFTDGWFLAFIVSHVSSVVPCERRSGGGSLVAPAPQIRLTRHGSFPRESLAPVVEGRVDAAGIVEALDEARSYLKIPHDLSLTVAAL